ncbi:MAG: metal ABC transporter substrate-binding protein, partial [Oscillospiraceae bacterium]|nr:metal ABC transporter substrate-binding protein [Oscillospiraceae bacterium]
AVRNGEEATEKTLALVAALCSEEVRTFIEETYGVSVVPVF